MESIILLIIVIIFSFVQSIIGIGLLLFGTPTLLVLGYTFIETLNILLLPSIAISFLQVISFKNKKNDKIIFYQNNFFIICIPSLILGLLIMSNSYEFINFNYIVSMLLLLSAISRLSIKFSNIIFGQLNNSVSKIVFFIIGIIHGITNLGGSFLSLYVSAIFLDSKIETRYVIALSYLVFGIIQIIYILLFHKASLDLIHLIYIAFAIIIFKIIGNKVFDLIYTNTYQKFITTLILIYSILLLI